MNWQKLFASHILERGYDYYCDGAVENIEIGRDDIRADVVGTEVGLIPRSELRMAFSISFTIDASHG